SDGRALVSEHPEYDPATRWGFIDRDGELVVSMKLESAGNYSEGMALAYRAGKWGYLDTAGDWVIEPTWQRAGYFQQGRAVVLQDGKAGLIDPTGAVVLAPEYLRLELRGALYEVQGPEGKGLVSPDGVVLASPTLAELGSERHGLVPAQPAADGPWGYLSATTGDWDIEPRFARAFEFGDDRAIVALDGERWAIIDRSGEVTHTFEGLLGDASHFAANDVA